MDGPGIPGLEDVYLWRPTIGKEGENSIVLVGGRIIVPGKDKLLKQLWRYDFNDAGGTWTKLLDSPDALANVEQNGIYMLSNPDLDKYATLLTCKSNKSN